MPTDDRPGDLDGFGFALAGVVLCAVRRALSGTMENGVVAAAGAGGALLLVVAMILMLWGPRRIGRGLVASVLTALQPGTGQMALGRFGAGAAIVAGVTAIFLTGHWWAAYAAGVAAAAVEFALRSREAERSSPPAHVRLMHCGALFLAVAAALGLFVHSGGRAQRGLDGDAVILLGGGQPRPAGDGTATEGRSVEAKRLMATGAYRRLVVVGLVSEYRLALGVIGGAGPGRRAVLPEGLVMGHVYARNTFTSARALDGDISAPVVVTNRFHMARTDLFWRAQGRPAVLFDPVRSRSVRAVVYSSAREAMAMGAYLCAMPWVMLGPPGEEPPAGPRK